MRSGVSGHVQTPGKSGMTYGSGAKCPQPNCTINKNRVQPVERSGTKMNAKAGLLNLNPGSFIREAPN